jgi:hypothetical protein
MINNELPFRVRHEDEFLEKIFDLRGTPTDPNTLFGVDPSAWSHFFARPPKPWKNVLKYRIGREGEKLLDGLLHLDPVLRLSAREAIDHKFF